MVRPAYRGFALTFALGCLQTSCVAALFSPPESKSGNYVVPPMPLPWVRIDPGSSDLAYQDPRDRTTMSVNSVCNQYQDMDLDDLTRTLKLGLTKSHVMSVDQAMIGSFPAQTTTIQGMEDGQAVTVSLSVLRTPRCVYDFLLVARPTAFASHQEDYRTLLHGFREKEAH